MIKGDLILIHPIISRSSSDLVRGGSESDSLHAMIVSVQHVDSTTAILYDRPRIVELARLSADVSPQTHQSTFEGEFLHAMVTKFTDVNVSFAVEDQVVRVSQLPRVRSLLAPGAYQLRMISSRVENLDAMVACVGDPDVIALIDGQILWPDELARFGPVTTPLK